MKRWAVVGVVGAFALFLIVSGNAWSLYTWAIFALLIGLPAWAFIDLIDYSEAVYRDAGESQTTWIWLLLLLPILGSAFYFFTARPKLQRAKEKRAAEIAEWKDEWRGAG